MNFFDQPRARIARALAEDDLDKTLPGEKTTLRMAAFAAYLATLRPGPCPPCPSEWKTFVFEPLALSEVVVALRALTLAWPDLEPDDTFTAYYQYLFCKLRDLKPDLDVNPLPWAAGMATAFLRVVSCPATPPQPAEWFPAWIAREKRQLLVNTYREQLVKKAWDFFLLPGDKDHGQYGEIGGCSALACLRKTAPQTWITRVETLLLFRPYEEISASFLRDFLHLELLCKLMKNRFDANFYEEWVLMDRNFHKHKDHLRRMRVPVIVEVRQKFTVFLFGEPLVARSSFGDAFGHWLRIMKDLDETLGLVDISALFGLIKEPETPRNGGGGNTGHDGSPVQ